MTVANSASISASIAGRYALALFDVVKESGGIDQLSDQIAADKYLASKDATKSKRRGLIFNKFVPPGTT